jgi:hypothetical protein
MEQVKLLSWVLEVDPKETMRLQAMRDSGSPEKCSCLPCRNFSMARSAAYPSAFRDILGRLGIPENRESEIWHGGEVGPGLCFYGGWFHFVGRIVSGPDVLKEGGGPVTLEPISESCSIGFTRRLALVPKEMDEFPVAQIEFSTHVPWIINEPYAG